MQWTLRHGGVDFSATPVVMGVLNVTPDSFSDGGLYADTDAAKRQADDMIAEGAGIIDVGPESTRPGAAPVSVDEQIGRIRPVLRGIRRTHPEIPISIDTRSADVAAEAIELGADIINDVSALRGDAGMAALAAKTDTPIVLMHMRGEPKTMQGAENGIVYQDVVGEITAFLTERVAFAESAGIRRERVAIDPGIGFGKTAGHNLEIIRRLEEFVALGFPVVLGVSRKRFIGELLDEPDPQQRLPGSVACAIAAVLAGVHVIRVHDVAETVEAVRVAAVARKAKLRGN